MGQFFEYVKMAVDNIRSNKGRSFLTMLGIIIGITSVVTIVSIGNGLKKDTVAASSEQNNTVTVLANSEEVSEVKIITSEDIAFLKSSLNDSITSIASIEVTAGNITTRKGLFEAAIKFTMPDYEHAQHTSPLVKGNYLTENDIANSNPVCVIDELTALHLFGNTNVIGMSIELTVDSHIQMVTIIGIRETPKKYIKEEKQFVAMGIGKSIAVEIPYTLSNSLGAPIETFSSVSMVAKDSDQCARIAKTSVQILNSKHQNLGENIFIQEKPTNYSDIFGPVLDGVTAFVALVAGISLIVGGIGVMNIMLVSVTERTREIGIRKALGAKTGSIISQFLCESAIISGMGGIIGIILGAGLTSLISLLGIGGINAQLSLPAIIIATIFSCSVGIIFGIYPARKAAKLSPIEALRRM